MSTDRLDELSARLFEAARQEPLPEGAQQRALSAARRELAAAPPVVRVSSAKRWGMAVTVVALAAGFTLYLRPRDAGIAISAEPASSLHRAPANRAPALATGAPSAALSASVVPSSVPPVTVPSSGPALVRAAPPTLSDELGALKLASNSLNSGDPKAALAALDRYDRVLKGSVMRSEATLLRIEALARAGQTDAASALAQRFVAQNPGSPLVDRARSFMHTEK